MRSFFSMRMPAFELERAIAEAMSSGLAQTHSDPLRRRTSASLPSGRYPRAGDAPADPRLHVGP